MSFRFSRRSLDALVGVSERLVLTVIRALELSSVDFAVHEGLRDLETQREYVNAGVSHTMSSLHLPQEDGTAWAVDLVPFVRGRLRWEWPPLFQVARAVRDAAREREVDLTWGACWDRPLGELEDPEEASEDYAARRRAQGLRVFLDGPHFQLR